MNRIVRAWNQWHEKPRYTGPDSVEIDGEKFLLEVPEMAERKKAETHPKATKDELRVAKVTDKSLIQKHMDADKFNNVIRGVRLGSAEKAKTVRQATYDTLRRLGVKRNLSKARKSTPNGSDHLDVGTLVSWLDSLSPKDKKAVRQAVILDATCVERSK